MNEAAARQAKTIRTLETTSEERTWAALAHASSLLTLTVSLGSAGIGAIPFVFIPLLIYLAYKDKSRFVARHAAQAVALQLVGTVGFFAALLALILASTLITVIGVLLTVILIGLVVLLLAALLWALVLPLGYCVVPVGLGVLAVVATVEAANGREYQYPYMGVYVSNWLDRQATTPAPAV